MQLSKPIQETETPPFNIRYAEDDAFYLCCITVLAILSSGVGGVMLWVGITFWNNCNYHVSLFLSVNGTATIAIALVKIFSLVLTLGCRKSCAHCQHSCVNIRIYLGLLVELSMLIWGTVVVLARYPSWVSEEAMKEDPFYCHKIPYLLAFAFTILNWLIMPVLFCTFICLLVGSFIRTIMIMRGRMHLSQSGGL